MSAGSTFSLRIDDAALNDLQRRLTQARLPDEAPGMAPWACGTDLGWMRRLLTHWQTRFDWRAQEARLNEFAQHRVDIQGVPLHYLHVRGEGDQPTPLLLMHGWPGSVFEFLDIIPRLTHPSRYGGRAEDAFTVVAPSLPGFGLSFRPGQPRLDPEQMADLLHALMTDLLGYRRYGAQGGDLGSSLATRLAYVYPQAVIGIHLNMVVVRADTVDIPSQTREEQDYLAARAAWQRTGIGYSEIQGTRPQTLAYALTDSPVGLAAWIADKFHAWTDGGGVPEAAVPLETLLANICLYWFTGAVGSSFWTYYARRHHSRSLPRGARVDVPMAYAEFPAENLKPPRSVLERMFSDIRQVTAMPHGGHFAAMEQPALLAGDVMAFFRSLRPAVA